MDTKDRELLDVIRGIQETQQLIATTEERKRSGWNFGNKM
ncbi:DUF3967 domain-containing protein [Priestia flexa]